MRESFDGHVKYTKDHEWIRVDGDVATIGITAYAQEQLGDVVFVEVPRGRPQGRQGRSVAVVESVKAASDIYAPVSGEVVEANAALGRHAGRRQRRRRGQGLVLQGQARQHPAELDRPDGPSRPTTAFVKSPR